MASKIYMALATALLLALQANADGNIYGKIIEKNTTQPLEFINITIQDAITKKPLQIVGTTDANGSFILSAIPDGNYIVSISPFGYIAQQREVHMQASDINLGNIPLANDVKLLQEVVVTGQKKQVSLSSERRLFNVSANIASTGGTADELLAAVPSVDVNNDGEISLRGNSDVMVWINGKEMGMKADNRAQFLRQIPAETVESIEVILNPSSRHSTEGTAGIINIRLRQDSRQGYFGNVEANVDSYGSINTNANINYNSGKFESFAAIGLKSHHSRGGSASRRNYDNGTYLNSNSSSKQHENSIFLRLGTNFIPSPNNIIYLSAIGSLGHKWGHTSSYHTSNLPSQWASNLNEMAQRGNTRGANILAGYKHSFAKDHFIDLNISYNIWQGPDNNLSKDDEYWLINYRDITWHKQHQDVKISNWEAAIDYSIKPLPWLRFETGYKGNYNHENSPASYFSGPDNNNLSYLPDLYNHFKYNTDISALYINFSGNIKNITFAAGVRGEAWQIHTRSFGFGQSDSDATKFHKNSFSLFPSASIGWNFLNNNQLQLSYSRRIRRPFGPQLNTFENIADPSEVHLGNPLILPEYSNNLELSYIKQLQHHTFSTSAYLRANNDMISHVSFLAPMASDPNVNTMYYGHANVGNMLNTGVEIIARNTLFKRLTLTTTFNIYNSHLKAWSTQYPLHGSFYPVHGNRQNHLTWDLRCLASLQLPANFTIQATGKYNSRRITAQGHLNANWDVEAAIRKTINSWTLSLICKDIFDSKNTHNVLYGNGYTQNIKKWSNGTTIRFAVAYTFGKIKHSDNEHHQHIDTGGYGEQHSH